MGLAAKLILGLFIINGIQNFFLSMIIRDIVSKLGKKADYYTRMFSDQVFLYNIIKNEKKRVSDKNIKLFWYSVIAYSLQIILFVLFIMSISLDW